MKEFLKKQFSFPTKGLIINVWEWGYAAYIFSIAGVYMYQAKIDSTYAGVASWIIVAGFFWILQAMQRRFGESMRKKYLKLIDLYDQLIDAYSIDYKAQKKKIEELEKENAELKAKFVAPSATPSN